jgi:hypothetical protein
MTKAAQLAAYFAWLMGVGASRRKKGTTMIAERFDARTLANMEVALERACEVLANGSEQHEARRHIASKILECAECGDKTLGGLTKAGRAAASELCAMHGA